MRIKLAERESGANPRVRRGHLVQQGRTEFPVFLRRLPDGDPLRAVDAARLRMDTHLLVRFVHPHAVRVLGPSAIEGTPAVVYADEGWSPAGPPLRAARTEGRVDLGLCMPLLASVAALLAALDTQSSAAPDARIYHPGPTVEDLLVGPKGSAKVLGLRVLRTQDGLAGGPVGSVPPERHLGTARSVYALAALFIELVTGERPPAPADATAWPAVRSGLVHRVGEALPHGPPPALSALLEAGMAWEPSDRPSVDELLAALQAATSASGLLGSAAQGAVVASPTLVPRSSESGLPVAPVRETPGEPSLGAYDLPRDETQDRPTTLMPERQGGDIAPLASGGGAWDPSPRERAEERPTTLADRKQAPSTRAQVGVQGVPPPVRPQLDLSREVVSPARLLDIGISPVQDGRFEPPAAPAPRSRAWAPLAAGSASALLLVALGWSVWPDPGPAPLDESGLPAPVGAPSAADGPVSDGAETKGAEASPAAAPVPSPAPAPAPAPAPEAASTPRPALHRVEFQATDPAVTALEVRCANTSGSGGTRLVVEEVAEGPCRVLGRTAETTRLAMVRVQGASTFLCFAAGTSSCESP